MHESKKGPRVMDIMDRQVVSVAESEEIRTAAQKLLKGETNHLRSSVTMAGLWDRDHL